MKKVFSNIAISGRSVAEVPVHGTVELLAALGTKPHMSGGAQRD